MIFKKERKRKKKRINDIVMRGQSIILQNKIAKISTQVYSSIFNIYIYIYIYWGGGGPKEWVHHASSDC